MLPQDPILATQLEELAALEDPEWNDPALWSSQWDQDRWELGPVPTSTTVDGPTDRDWEEYRKWCEECDERDALRRMEDEACELRARFGEGRRP